MGGSRRTWQWPGVLVGPLRNVPAVVGGANIGGDLLLLVSPIVIAGLQRRRQATNRMVEDLGTDRVGLQKTGP